MDASVAASWYLPAQASATATILYERAPRPAWRAPHCFFYEFNNLLLKQERRGVLNAYAAEQIGADLRRRFGLQVEPAPDDVEMALAMSLARRHGIALFDGFYLLLTMQLQATLVTRDERLASACHEEACGVLHAGGVAP